MFNVAIVQGVVRVVRRHKCMRYCTDTADTAAYKVVLNKMCAKCALVSFICRYCDCHKDINGNLEILIMYFKWIMMIYFIVLLVIFVKQNLERCVLMPLFIIDTPYSPTSRIYTQHLYRKSLYFLTKYKNDLFLLQLLDISLDLKERDYSELIAGLIVVSRSKHPSIIIFWV